MCQHFFCGHIVKKSMSKCVVKREPVQYRENATCRTLFTTGKMDVILPLLLRLEFFKKETIFLIFKSFTVNGYQENIKPLQGKRD